MRQRDGGDISQLTDGCSGGLFRIRLSRRPAGAAIPVAYARRWRTFRKVIAIEAPERT